MQRSKPIALRVAALVAAVSAIAGAAHAEVPIGTTGATCRLQGTAPMPKGALLYDAAQGGQPIAQFTGVAVPMTMASIPLSDPNGRARLSTSAGTPGFRLDGWVPANQVPLFTSQDLPVVPGNLWIGANQQVTLVGATADSLRIERSISGARGRSIPATAPCSFFTLSPGVGFAPFGDEGSKGFRTRKSTVDLYAGPGGSPVYTLVLEEGSTQLFWGFETQNGYRHVRARTDLVFDVWVRQRLLEPLLPGNPMDVYVSKPPVGAIIGLNDPKPPVKRVTKDVPIRLQPGTEKQVVGNIENGSDVYVLAHTEGWSTVLPLTLAVKAPEGMGFWVPEADVEP